VSLFEITQGGFFEDIQSELKVFPILDKWENLPSSPNIEVRQRENYFWLSCFNIGAISINCDSLKVSTYPAEQLDPNKFDEYFYHVWLPMAYQLCGIQVLHASAVVNLDNQNIIIFPGDSGSGKSTLAFGFAKREKWAQIADDRIAFTSDGDKIKPVYIPDKVKLRPASANFFKQDLWKNESCSWLDTEMVIKSIIFLFTEDNQVQNKGALIKIEPASKLESYELLLKQAITFTTKIIDNNKRLLENYFSLANQTKTYKLTHSKDFDVLKDVYNAIEETVI